MKKLQEKVEQIANQIKEIETKENEKLFINEMKKIGIEKLPYSYSALKQFIDPETMSYHYNGHYKTYVEKLNDALSKKDYGDVELEEIIKSIGKYNKTIRNNAGGAFNHALFWKMLSPTEQKCSGQIYNRIKKDFHNFLGFKQEFTEKAKRNFGSGWIWLVLSKSGSLKIMTTPNQDNPLMNLVRNGGYPLLGLDLWEHAYYLRYKNKRDDYVKNFFKAINWKFVNQMYTMRIKTKLDESITIKKIISEGVSESCSKQENEAYRFIFNTNLKVKKAYKIGINYILRQVFSDRYYKDNEYGDGEMFGIYDLEGEGRSVLNFLNTNYSGFCILVNDINKLLKANDERPLNFIGRTPSEQFYEIHRMIKIIDEFKLRIFSTKSKTFQNLIATLSKTSEIGKVTEEFAVIKLKERYGNENVSLVGKLGSSKDANEGIDSEIIVDGKIMTAQIKPFGSYTLQDGAYTLYNTASVKEYLTDWLVFFNKKSGVLVFDNNNTKIVGGNYTIPSTSLIEHIK
jgi:Fe-Mn family superoxide dismutase